MLNSVNNLPLVSIVMPAYNAGAFICETIQSVLAQTYTNWELIIVNDASSDDTEAIVRQFTDSRIYYIASERLGSPSKVRNKALQLSKGDFITFLDADDTYYPDALMTLYKALEAKPKWNAVHGYYEEMDGSSIKIEDGGSIRRSALQHEGKAFTAKDLVLFRQFCMLSAMMMRRSAFESIGLFDETLCGPEDVQFFMKLRLLDFNGLGSIDANIYRYRIYGSSLTRSADRYMEVLKSGLRLREWLFTEAGLPYSVNTYKAQSYARAYFYIARQMLQGGHAASARQVLNMAWQDPHVSASAWCKKLLPLSLRSFLPRNLNNWMASSKRQLKVFSS
jgi:glycosyltransferase involved in cell wall biosynthesis